MNVKELDAFRVIYSAANSWRDELGNYVITGASCDDDRKGYQDEHDELADALILFGDLAKVHDNGGDT